MSKFSYRLLIILHSFCFYFHCRRFYILSFLFFLLLITVNVLHFNSLYAISVSLFLLRFFLLSVLQIHQLASIEI